MFHSNPKPELKANINLAPFNALLAVMLIFCLFLKQFIFVFFIILIYILFYLDKRLAIKSAFVIEDDVHHIYPVVGSSFPYKIFIQGTMQHTLKLRLSIAHNQFENNKTSMTLTTMVTPNEMTVIHLPIIITERGRFNVTLTDIETQGYFNLLRYTVKQQVKLSTLYASYGTYHEKHLEHLQSVDNTGQRTLGTSSEKYSNTVYQYDTPFHYIDFNASLKANQLLVKQTEVYETRHVILTASVLSHQHIHHQVEHILKALSDYTYTYFYQQIPFFIALNIKSSLISNEPVIIAISSSNDINMLHQTIAAFNQDSYTFPMGSLVSEILNTQSVHHWIHFGDITDSDIKRIEQQQIHFERGEFNV